MARLPTKEETYEGWDRAIHFLCRRIWVLAVLSFAAMFALGALLPKSLFSSIPSPSLMQNSRNIAIALYLYAQEHGGKYPEGKSSTEVFQHLVDAGLITSADTFYFPMTGKVKPEATKGKITLKPESVCFDVTAGITEDSPDQMPVVYLTGYQVPYGTGHDAWRLENGLPEGIVVSFKDLNTRFIPIPPEGRMVRDFLPPLDPKGPTYRQLTP